MPNTCSSFKTLHLHWYLCHPVGSHERSHRCYAHLGWYHGLPSVHRVAGGMYSTPPRQALTGRNFRPHSILAPSICYQGGTLARLLLRPGRCNIAIDFFLQELTLRSAILAAGLLISTAFGSVRFQSLQSYFGSKSSVVLVMGCRYTWTYERHNGHCGMEMVTPLAIPGVHDI